MSQFSILWFKDLWLTVYKLLTGQLANYNHTKVVMLVYVRVSFAKSVFFIIECGLSYIA